MYPVIHDKQIKGVQVKQFVNTPQLVLQVAFEEK
jgi:hypothetical protein